MNAENMVRIYKMIIFMFTWAFSLTLILVIELLVNMTNHLPSTDDRILTYGFFVGIFIISMAGISHAEITKMRASFPPT